MSSATTHINAQGYECDGPACDGDHPGHCTAGKLRELTSAPTLTTDEVMRHVLEKLAEVESAIIGMTTRVESLEATQSEILDKINKVVDDVKPAMDKLMTSPVFRMLGGR